MRSPSVLFLALGLGCSFIGGCEADRGTGTPSGIEVVVAPMSLPGADEVCYGVYIQSGAGDVVVALPHLCSGQYGNGPGGDLAYVAPCDASEGNAQTTVTLVLEGIDVQPGPGTTWADEATYVNPCGWGTGALPGSAPLTTPTDTAAPLPPGGDATVNSDGFVCRRTITCEPNADVRVAFDLTVMRDAGQGFFDVGVDFEDVFCAAKLDTCYEGERPITLLFDDQGNRVHTAVMASACTAGPGASSTTVMWMSEVTVSCDGGVSFTIDPTGADPDPERDGAPGNHCTSVGGHPICYGLYWGDEALRCPPNDVPCNKAYWNLALDLESLADAGLTGCSLHAAVTANSPSDLSQFVDGQLRGPGQAYGFVGFDAQVTGTSGAPECFQGPIGSPHTQALYGMTPDLSPSNPFPQLCYSFTQGAAGPVAHAWEACSGDDDPPDDDPPELCDPPGVGGVGLVATRAVDGNGNVILELMFGYDQVVTVLAAFDAIAVPAGALHADFAGGSWAPQLAMPGASDTFVTVGGAPGFSNSTSADPGWGASGFNQPGMPAGAGWFNSNPPNLQGQADGNFRARVARLVLGPSATAPVTLGLTVAFNHGLGTSVQFVSQAITIDPTTGCTSGATYPSGGPFEPDDDVDGVELAHLLAAWALEDCRWDLDGNGTVNAADLAILLAAWGPGTTLAGSCGPPTGTLAMHLFQADFNGDGQHDFFDLLDYLGAWSGGGPVGLEEIGVTITDTAGNPVWSGTSSAAGDPYAGIDLYLPEGCYWIEVDPAQVLIAAYLSTSPMGSPYEVCVVAGENTTASFALEVFVSPLATVFGDFEGELGPVTGIFGPEGELEVRSFPGETGGEWEASFPGEGYDGGTALSLTGRSAPTPSHVYGHIFGSAGGLGVDSIGAQVWELDLKRGMTVDGVTRPLGPDAQHARLTLTLGSDFSVSLRDPGTAGGTWQIDISDSVNGDQSADTETSRSDWLHVRIALYEDGTFEVIAGNAYLGAFLSPLPSSGEVLLDAFMTSTAVPTDQQPLLIDNLIFEVWSP